MHAKELGNAFRLKDCFLRPHKLMELCKAKLCSPMVVFTVLGRTAQTEKIINTQLPAVVDTEDEWVKPSENLIFNGFRLPLLLQVYILKCRQGFAIFSVCCRNYTKIATVYITFSVNLVEQFMLELCNHHYHPGTGVILLKSHA